SGTPLLAAYRPGAFHPAMPVLALLAPFTAFQVLVLASLAAAGPLVYAYLRLVGASRVGAYTAGLAFPLGPYLVAHVGDTATVTAAPLLPLVLLATEIHLRRGTLRAAAGLSAAAAMLLLAGSPEAVGAGALLGLGRLALGHLSRGAAARPLSSLLALAVGTFLAAPQLVPAFLAWKDAGAGATGVAAAPGAVLPGVTGLLVRYVSHTPGPGLALAALPLLLTHVWVRRAMGALVAGVVLLRWQPRLADPGAGALLLDFALAVLLGLSLSVQWAARREPFGRRLRAWLLLGCLASAAALSVAAAYTGPLPQVLAGAVGVLAVALVLYFPLAEARDPVAAHAFLIPLTVSFLLQPHGREAFQGAPTADDLVRPTPTREAIDRAMGPRREERTLSLVPAWPRAAEADLAFANRGGLVGRRNAEGYDPMVSRARLRLYDGMSAFGTLPRDFFRSDAGRLELLGIRFVQVPSAALATRADAWGLGEDLALTLEPARARFFPLPITRATELRFASSLARAVDVPQGEVVARVMARLAYGREIELPVRAGIDTAEWAWDRPDVRARVRHARPPLAASFPVPGAEFEGHHYLATIRLPARYAIDGLRFEAAPGAPPLSLLRVGVTDGATGRATGVSLIASYVSDTVRLAESAATPNVRLFEVLRGVGRAWVVESLRLLPDEEALLRQLREPTRAGIDSRRVALALQREAAGVALPGGSRSSRAELAREAGGRLELRAEGPGLLVVTESWDDGWTAEVDERPARLLRVNGGSIGLVLTAGTHRVLLQYRARGLVPGVILACLGALGLVAATLRTRLGAGREQGESMKGGAARGAAVPSPYVGRDRVGRRERGTGRGTAVPSPYVGRDRVGGR
ncbi:MAG TPA: hypothetical protein VLI67_07090, partial [Vicinamibacteria bacterium]|nr:hypothetical protein [Vicinamibacteria bacterium]